MKLQPSEHKIQVALCDYLYIAKRPEIVFGAIPNGGRRHVSVGVKLKAEGVQRGTPDMFFCLPGGRVGWLELKNGKGSLQPEQKAFRDRVVALGHLWAMARSVDEALIHLSEWGVMKDAYRKVAA